MTTVGTRGMIGKAISVALPYLSMMEVLTFSTVRKCDPWARPVKRADRCTLDIYNEDGKSTPKSKIPCGLMHAMVNTWTAGGNTEQLHPLAATRSEGQHKVDSEFVFLPGGRRTSACCFGEEGLVKRDCISEQFDAQSTKLKHWFIKHLLSRVSSLLDQQLHMHRLCQGI